MSNFSVIHDLSTLSEAERQQYLRDASQYFGLDPSLNALDLIWMDNGGLRRLVAYARRGTTDLLREIHQINVLSVTMQTAPGFVSFTAVGKNAKGRQEIAVGAAGTDGLKGDKIAAAVATAQTRATRRLTLQFVGGGLLDESEIGNNTMTDINRLPVSLSSIATAPVQPVVEANTDAGKDVTPVSVQVVDAAPVQVDYAEEPKRKRRKKTAEDIVEQAGLQTEVQSPIIPLVEAVSPSADIPESLRTPPSVVASIETGEPQSINEVAAQVLATFPTDEQEKEFRARLGVFTNGVLKEGGMTDGIIWRVRKYTKHLCPDALIDNGKMKLTVAEWTKLLDSLESINKVGGAKTLVTTINEVAEKA